MKVFIVINQTEIPRDSIIGVYTSSDIIPSNIKNNKKYSIKETELIEKKIILNTTLNPEIEEITEIKIQQRYPYNYHIFYEGKIKINGKIFEQGNYEATKIIANELLEFNRLNEIEQTLFLVRDLENDYNYIASLKYDVDEQIEKFNDYLLIKKISLLEFN